VGLAGVGFGVDLKFLHTVGDHPLCGFEKSGRFGHIATRVFEGIDDQLFLIVLNCPFEGEGREGTGLFASLKGRGR